MKIKEYRIYFTKELEKIYPKTEIDSFFFQLIEEILNLEIVTFFSNPDFIISSNQLLQFNTILERLKKEEPLQYILGKTEFYGLPFIVTPHTLIPRPETEELVEWVLNNVNTIKEKKKEKQQISILDIGTGTGCIAISLKKQLTNANITAIDISKEALKVAEQNAILNGVEIAFVQQDILQTKQLADQFDIIVSNPPYVRELEKIEIKNNVLQNEPHSALFVSDDNALIFYDKIADLAKKQLTKNGLLFFEINQYLGKETLDLLTKKGFANIKLRKDLLGNERMIKAQKHM
ncbi:peptide chain release factor N(5)-glutamine methyltransferase [Tenacibaculum sp. UWU-22]|uniref:peptide chain release factor N(5)-glutamine methyltransferase n=1 Tax=Tenacibaculum sp. UWU-22 TaxID=3234187 RepID=UPI0034DB3B45